MQLDLVEKKAKNWHEEGVVPSEPFFVPRPGATEEDDGKFCRRPALTTTALVKYLYMKITVMSSSALI